jgi:hypothetical protein
MVTNEMKAKLVEQMKGATSKDLLIRINSLQTMMANPQGPRQTADVATKRDEMELWVELAQAELTRRGTR